MATGPMSLSDADSTTVPPARPRRAVYVVEDWFLAGWVALATPLLFRLEGGSGPFDGGAPLLGLLRLVAVLGALVCLAARPDPANNVPRGRSLVNSGAVGPLCGGVLLVAISGFTALDATSGVGVATVVAFAVVMTAVRVVAPPLRVAYRRALVTPFVMVAGGLFWTFIAEVTGEPGTVSPVTAASNAQTAVAAIAFLLAFSAVYYAMLVYAPRQVAEREGGLMTWVLRYVLFVAGVAFGLAWPRLFGV